MPRPAAPPSILTTGPIARTLLMFTLPALGSNILQSLNASVNAVWIGHYLGEAALSACSNANVLLFFLLGAVFGIGMANTILVARAVGGGHQDEARRVIGTSASLFALVSVLVSAAGYLFTPQILALMLTPAAAMDYAIAYLRIIFIALPVMWFFTFVMMALRGTGDSRTPFWFMLLSVLIDIALNPLLIFGVGPFPAMGIAGSAMATLVAQLVSLLAMLALLYRRRHFLCLRRHSLHLLRIDPVIARLLVTKGVPMSLQIIVISSSALALVALVNRHGADVSAGYGVATQLWSYISMPALALGASVSSMAAQNIGANRWHRVAQISRTGVYFNFLMTGALVALLYAFNRQAIGLFLPQDSVAMAAAEHVNLVVAWSFVPFGITQVLFGVIRATGAVMPALVIMFVSLWLVRLPVAWLLEQRYGQDMLWWSFPMATGLAVVMTAVYYRWGSWRQARMAVPAAPAHGATAGAGPARAAAATD